MTGPTITAEKLPNSRVMVFMVFVLLGHDMSVQRTAIELAVQAEILTAEEAQLLHEKLGLGA